MRACIATALVALTSATCLAGGIRIGDTQAARIAKDLTISGKGQPGSCLPFANALQKKFEAAGIPSRVIVYGYEQGGAPVITPVGDIVAQPVGIGSERRSHAIVVYNDGGRSYVMDNQSWSPRWIRDGSPMEIAQQFSGIQCVVKTAEVLPKESAPKMPARKGGHSRLAAN